MTTWDAVAACRRRWWAVVVGLAATLAALFAVQSASGVYFSQQDVVFLAPPSPARPNVLGDTTQGLIAFAGVIEREYNADKYVSPTSSSRVTLVDEGIYHGTLVQLPNAGGQWAYSFTRPVLSVQAAGASPDEVRAEMSAAVGEISRILDHYQDVAGVNAGYRVQLDLSPNDPDVQYLQGRPSRASIVTLLMGVVLSIALAVVIDRPLRLRGSRRTDRHPPLAVGQ